MKYYLFAIYVSITLAVDICDHRQTMQTTCQEMRLLAVFLYDLNMSITEREILSDDIDKSADISVSPCCCGEGVEAGLGGGSYIRKMGVVDFRTANFIKTLFSM